MTTKRKEKYVEGDNILTKKWGDRISEENTVIDSESHFNTDQASVAEVTPEVVLEVANQPEEQKVEANILMIDELYDFDSEPPLEDVRNEMLEEKVR